MVKGLANIAFSIKLVAFSAVVTVFDPHLAANAQVVLDGTLIPGNAGVVPLASPGIYEVESGRGLQVGNDNLFHSFDQFTLNFGELIQFENPGVENIVTRVTGGNPSDIAGTISVLGDANFYLINPRGIVFNDGAEINVGGAFAASTANGVLFGSTVQFNATQPSQFDGGLLTVVGNPTGFSYTQPLPSPILVNQLTGRAGQPILLAGGDVTVNGQLRARGGLVEITGVSAPGTVEIINTPAPNDPLLAVEIDVADGAPRSNFLINGGVIDVSTDSASPTFDGGSIGIKARNIDLRNGSAICGGIGAAEDCGGGNRNVSGGETGNILLDAIGRVRLLEGSSVVNRIEGDANDPSQRASGNNRRSIFDAVSNFLNGQGFLFGSVIVNTGSLEIIGDGSSISATSRGTFGNAGLVLIRAQDSVSIVGGNGNLPVGLFSQVAPSTQGDAGGILVQANSISVRNNALVTSRNSGVGDAGRIFLGAEEILVDNSSIISTIGFADNGIIFPGLGDGGNIELLGSSIFLLNGAEVSTSVESSTGVSNAGFIDINTANLFLDNSRIVSAIRPNGFGEAGNLLIRAGSLKLSNNAEISTDLEGISSGLNIVGRSLIDALLSGNFSNVVGSILIFSDSVLVENDSAITASVSGSGNGGSILAVVENDILLRNGGAIISEADSGTNAITGAILLDSERLGLIGNSTRISVRNDGENLAGLILINASVIALGSNSEINAQTNSMIPIADDAFDRVNILLDSEFLSLSGNSNIRTDARGIGDGGNIRLDVANTIFSSPTRDSNISADARGTGGRITFSDALLLRNIAPRPQSPASNDISAVGGIQDGEILFQSGVQDLNPVQEQVTFPTELIDASRLIAQGCAAGNLAAAEDIGELVVTGRGGLPPAPNEQVGDAGIVPELVEVPGVEAAEPASPIADIPEGAVVSPIAPSPPPIVEAQGWTYQEDGSVMLTASANAVAPVNVFWTMPGCDDV